MRSLGGIRRWVSSLPAHWRCRGRSGADDRAALREEGAAALHVEAADGRVLSLVVRDGQLRLRGDGARGCGPIGDGDG
jgi:hypothetical protein